ncbi:hypothetical protein [Burkholderia sp. BE17]|uniref:hypothetical protein n=1 Tax=Burkholderia sp. BE17 TaxID=2656644 RepID=UPI00128C5D62|nr:hypothetical protein [Burkholderia sp. BE17]MPV68636.1 hypothetical protein [Burkholderia sp. BE17]
MKYRKKGAFVDAVRCEDLHDHPLLESTESGWHMPTPEGWLEVRNGDWIVTDSSGIARPMADSVFTLLYEPVSGD